MNTAEYNRLLKQMLLAPLLALALLALGLGYSLHRVRTSAAWVDHSDQVTANVNRIVKLILDEETATRGYLLTHDPAFLEPYNRAERILPQEFQVTLAMVRDDADQTARLRQMLQSYQQFRITSSRMLGHLPVSTGDLRVRKRQMDGIRAQADAFLNSEAVLRRQRSVTARDTGDVAIGYLVGLVILVGLGIAWVTQRCFFRVRDIYGLQIQECNEQRNLAVEREGWLNTTLRSIGDAVIACDPEGRVSLMNAVAEELTGWNEQDSRGRPLPEIFNIVNEYTRAVVENPVEKVMRTGGTVGLANHTILIRRDGSEVSIDDAASPIRGANDQIVGIVLVFRDCTERRSSQVALMRAEKLAAAGKLAAAIAHEVNNPLEGLTNVLYLAAESKDMAEVQRWLVQAQSEVNRLSHITRQTLGFYRENKQPTEYRPSDVAEEVLSFYVPEAQTNGVQLEAQIRTSQLTYGVPGELRQVLSNLIANSIDAMPEGGTIRLVVREATSLQNSSMSGIRITVADNGSGIPPDILGRVFEPFFTTKLDTGTGLGLWVSKELVEKQGGQLHVRSCNTGTLTGTVFSIYIPLLADGQDSDAQQSPDSLESTAL